MRNEFYNLVNELNNMFYTEGSQKGFPVDVVEIEGGYEVVAEIPGVNKENIEITFEEGTLVISAKRTIDNTKKYLLRERTDAKLKRSIYFGDINEESLKAKYENGLLTVTINVKAPEVKQKKSIIIE